MKSVACPIFTQELPIRENKLTHYASHAAQTNSGNYDYRYRCGEADGYWPTHFRAAAGMADHFAKRYDIFQAVSLGQ